MVYPIIGALYPHDYRPQFTRAYQDSQDQGSRDP